MLIEAYKLADKAIKAKSLVSIFIFSPPTPGFIVAERVEAHSPAGYFYAHFLHMSY
jgi:hypothetical protein